MGRPGFPASLSQTPSRSDLGLVTDSDSQSGSVAASRWRAAAAARATDRD